MKLASMDDRGRYRWTLVDDAADPGLRARVSEAAAASGRPVSAFVAEALAAHVDVVLARQGEMPDTLTEAVNRILDEYAAEEKRHEKAIIAMIERFEEIRAAAAETRAALDQRIADELAALLAIYRRRQ